MGYLRRAGRQNIGIELLKPRIDFTSEHADAVHGVVVLEEAGLAHDQQVAVAADMIPVFLELRENLIRRAGKHGAGFDRAFHRRLRPAA